MKSRSMRKVLVTGRAGFISSAAVRQLMNEADAIKGTDPNSANSDELADLDMLLADSAAKD